MSDVPGAGTVPERTSRRWLIPWVCLSLVVVILLLALWQLTPTASLVQIEANTEVLRLQIPRGEPLDWNVAGFKVTFDCDVPKGQPALIWPESERRLVVRGPARAEFTRAGSNGVLRITVSPDPQAAARAATTPAASAAGKSAADAQTPSPDPCAQSVVYAGSDKSLTQMPIRGAVYLSRSIEEVRTSEPPALTFRVRGVPALGDDVAGGVDHLMLSGEVTLIQTTHWRTLGEWFGLPASFVADQRKLGMGDRVVPRARGETAAAGGLDANAHMTGFVRVTGGKPMTVVLQGALDSVSVYRFNDFPVEVEKSLWLRIKNDPLLSYLIAMLGVVYGLGQMMLQTSWENFRRPPKIANAHHGIETPQKLPSTIAEPADADAPASNAPAGSAPAGDAPVDSACAGDAPAVFGGSHGPMKPGASTAAAAATAASEGGSST